MKLAVDDDEEEKCERYGKVKGYRKTASHGHILALSNIIKAALDTYLYIYISNSSPSINRQTLYKASHLCLKSSQSVSIKTFCKYEDFPQATNRRPFGLGERKFQ